MAEPTLLIDAKEIMPMLAELTRKVDMLLQQSGKPLTQKEACEFLDVTRATLISWEKKGNVKPVTIGKRKYYISSELLKIKPL